MSPWTNAARAGLARGRAEVRQTLTNGQDLWNYLFPTMIFLVVMFFMRDSTVPGTNFSLGSRTLPSVIGMGIAFGGLVTLMMQLAVEREDGTLLRAKAIPNGMLGYLVGKIVTVSGMTVVAQLFVLIPSLFMLDGISMDWFTLVWVIALGLIATLPLGAVAGSMFSNPRNSGLIMLGVSAYVVVEAVPRAGEAAQVAPGPLLLVGATGLVVNLVCLVLLLVPGAFMLDGLALDSVGAWLTLVWVVLLGSAAMLPMGAVLGSLIANPRSQGLVMLPLSGLVAISGIFYPITAMASWLQVVAQVFPVYWLGIGVRSALLPDEAAAVELTGTWRQLETLGVLGAWTVAGVLLAPVVLRRMARRESGSSVAARREKAMQRIG